MPKDRYSDNYTIEVLQDNIFGVSSENINISEEDFSAVAANSVSIVAGTGSFVVDSTGGVDIATIGSGATIDINSGGTLNFVAATGIVLSSPSHDITADSPNFTIDESGVTCDALITAGLQLTASASADSVLVSSSDGTARWSSMSDAIDSSGALEFSGLDIHNSVAATEGWSTSDTNRSSSYDVTARFNDVFGLGSPDGGSSDIDALYPPSIVLCPWGDIASSEADGVRAATAGILIGSRSRGTDYSPNKGLFSMLTINGSEYTGHGGQPVVLITHRNADTTERTQWNGSGSEPANYPGHENSDDQGRGSVILELCFEEVEDPVRRNWFMTCSDKTDVNRGGLRGSNNYQGSEDVAYGLEVADYITQWYTGVDDSYYDSYGYTRLFNGSGQQVSNGSVVFQSGGADYGEWLELGDPLEWGYSSEEIARRVLINGIDPPILGLLEGVLVRVRDAKIWKEGSGRVMAITNRSCIVGNAEAIKAKDGPVGEVVSFIGQLPIFVKGLAKQGDYIIPGPLGYGLAVSSDDITFEQYKSAIGTIWEDKDKEEIFRILCAVGVK